VPRDQLERASLSIALSIAEGAGQRSRPDRAASTASHAEARMSARPSSIYCACEPWASEAACSQARELLVRIVKMLAKLQQRMVGPA
jgi:four helix bundle protein